MEYGNKATGTATELSRLSQPESPLQSVLNDNGEQLDKLMALVANLSNRLESVRRPTPPTDQVENLAKEGQPYSSTVSQLKSQTETIKSIQRFVSNISEELDV